MLIVAISAIAEKFIFRHIIVRVIDLFERLQLVDRGIFVDLADPS